MLHAVLGIESQNDLLGHPVYGASWEGFVIENILALLPNWRASFYRSSSGSEIDLIIEKGKQRIGIECKASASIGFSKGFWNAVNDLKLDEVRVIAPVAEAYPVAKDVSVSPLGVAVEYLTGMA